MTAIAWSLVGLMAASLGVLVTAIFGLMGRIDGLGGSLGARIDRLDASLSERIDAQAARIDAQGAALGSRIDGLTETVHALDVRLTRAGS